MDPSLILSAGVPGVLLAGIGFIWREWQADRRKAEDRYTAALAESREDAKAMHQLAADLGQAADAIGQINVNGGKIDKLAAQMYETLSLVKTLKGIN